jgi:hypothetical protein
MKTTKSLTLLIVALMTWVGASAQDMIITKNADTLKCKIREVGTEEIKYTLPDYPPDVLFVMNTQKIIHAIFETGQVMDFVDEMNNPGNYTDQNKNAIKIDFLSPTTGNTTFAYERSIKPGQSWEATLGIIGLGADPNDYDPRGTFVKFGMKFIKSPDFYLKGMRYAHILKGAYVKPEIGFGFYRKYDEWYIYEPWLYEHSRKRDDYYSLIVQIVVGKQWVINDIFLFDFFGGVGFGFDDGNGNYHYGYAITPDIPMSFSAGLKIGVLF